MGLANLIKKQLNVIVLVCLMLWHIHSSMAEDCCTDGDIKVDPQDCAAYYQCCSGQFVNLKCASGSYFDDILKACVIDTEGVCPQ